MEIAGILKEKRKNDWAIVVMGVLQIFAAHQIVING